MTTNHLRDRIANALRDADCHSCQYDEGIDANDLADAVLAALPGTCDASLNTGPGTTPIGPCVLRHGHDGPVHQAADGAKWWLHAPAAEAHATVQAVTREQLHEAIRVLARRDPAWWRNELARMARVQGRTNLLGGHA